LDLALVVLVSIRSPYPRGNFSGSYYTRRTYRGAWPGVPGVTLRFFSLQARSRHSVSSVNPRGSAGSSTPTGGGALRTGCAKHAGVIRNSPPLSWLNGERSVKTRRRHTSMRRSHGLTTCGGPSSRGAGRSMPCLTFAWRISSTDYRAPVSRSTRFGESFGNLRRHGVSLLYEQLPGHVHGFLGTFNGRGEVGNLFVSTKEEMERQLRWARRQWSDPTARLRGERVRSRKSRTPATERDRLAVQTESWGTKSAKQP